MSWSAILRGLPAATTGAATRRRRALPSKNVLRISAVRVSNCRELLSSGDLSQLPAPRSPLRIFPSHVHFPGSLMDYACFGLCMFPMFHSDFSSQCSLSSRASRRARRKSWRHAGGSPSNGFSSSACTAQEVSGSRRVRLSTAPYVTWLRALPLGTADLSISCWHQPTSVRCESQIHSRRRLPQTLGRTFAIRRFHRLGVLGVATIQSEPYPGRSCQKLLGLQGAPGRGSLPDPSGGPGTICSG